MRRPSPVPVGLARQAIRAADAPMHGVSRKRADRADVGRPYYGVRLFGDVPMTPIDRCRALAPMLLDGQFFSHVTALELHGVPRLVRQAEADLAVEFPRTPPRGEGVRGHALRHVALTVVFGLPVSTGAFAWCESAATLDLDQLVAAGDALLTGPRVAGRRTAGVATLGELQTALAIHRGSPGARRLQRAIGLIRSGVDSVQETATRLALVRAGLPEPSTDVPVVVAGGRVLHSDLGYPELRIAIEYEGDGHRTSRAQWERDVERHELMRAAGWIVIRVTARMLAEGAQSLAHRVRAAIESRRASSPA